MESDYPDTAPIVTPDVAPVVATDTAPIVAPAAAPIGAPAAAPIGAPAAAPVAAPFAVSTMQTPRDLSKYLLWLSVTQVIAGFLCIVIQMIVNGADTRLHRVGQGTWTGLFFIVTGAVGVLSIKRKTARYTLAFLVLAIISAVMTLGILIFSSQDISDSWGYTGKSANAVLIIVGIGQGVVAIISAAFVCYGLCGWNLNQRVMVAGQVHYVQGPDGQQQMVIVPFNQDAAGLPGGPSFNPVYAQLPPYEQTVTSTDESETKLPIPE